MEVKIIRRPAFCVAGAKTWISGQDNQLFGRFWKQCQDSGLLEKIQSTRDQTRPGGDPQTGGVVLGISWIEGNNPDKRSFYYMIAAETAPCSEHDPEAEPQAAGENPVEQPVSFCLENAVIPEGLWAVFPCIGSIPDSIMHAEMYAFNEWLPNSAYRHAGTVEMEVYLPGGAETACEFWVQIAPRE